MSQPTYSMQGLTIDELIDIVQGDLTVSCSLPKLLPDLEIRRLVETQAMPWFFHNYRYAVHKIYYYIQKEAFTSDEWSKYGYIQMPHEIQSIVWLYQVRDASLFNIGINAPNLSINLGVTNQPYISSYVTTIGELGVYKSVLDSFSDMLNQFSKYTIRHHYNPLSQRLHVLGNIDTSMVAECYSNVQLEALFGDVYFQRYVTGLARMQLGNLMSRYSFKLPGGVEYNGTDLKTEGKEMVDKVEEEIKGMTNSDFLFMVKR